MASKTRIEMIEVGPRDGLQNERTVVSTADKAELVRRAIAFGARRIEVTSFVNPSRVPQLADAEQLVAMLPDRDDVTYIGLVLNRRGAERALATGRIDELGAVCVTSDAFGIRNQGQSSDESLAAAIEIVELAHAAGRSAQITIATAFGCPFAGEVPMARVIDVAKRAADAQPREVSSMRRSAGSAAAPSRRARRAMWRPRMSSICSNAAASRPASRLPTSLMRRHGLPK